MDEVTLQWVNAVRLLIVGIYANLYGFGGMNGKWKRRVLGSLLLTIGIMGISLWVKNFSFYYLLCFPLLWGATSIGYGVEDDEPQWMKPIKRTYCGLAYACATLPVFIVTGNWLMFALHTVFCLLISNMLGVYNPVIARNEETLIGVIISLLPLFTI